MSTVKKVVVLPTFQWLDYWSSFSSKQRTGGYLNMDRVQMLPGFYGDLKIFKAECKKIIFETEEKQDSLKITIAEARNKVKNLIIENHRVTKVRIDLNEKISQLKEEVSDLVGDLVGDLESCQPTVDSNSQPSENLLSFDSQITSNRGSRQISANASSNQELRNFLNRATSSQLFLTALYNQVRENDITHELENELKSLESRINKLKTDNENTTFENMQLISEKKALEGRKFLLKLEAAE